MGQFAFVGTGGVKIIVFERILIFYAKHGDKFIELYPIKTPRGCGVFCKK